MSKRKSGQNASFNYVGKKKGNQHQGTPNETTQLGATLEPYGRYDADIQRFCCRTCGNQFETFRGIKAHLATEHL